MRECDKMRNKKKWQEHALYGQRVYQNRGKGMGVINRGNRKKYVTSCAIWPDNFIEKREREGSDKTREQGKIKKNMCCMAKE